MHNDHIYKYYRWQGWIAKQQGRLMRQFFMYEWANEERNAQYNCDLGRD